MFNLVIKEFLVQKKTMLYGLIYIIFSAFAFQNVMPNGGAIYTISPYVIVYLFVVYSCGYDDKNKTDIIFNSLPVKRDDIVISKYLAVFFFAAFGIICSAVLGLFATYTGIAGINRLITANDIVIVLSGGLIFTSIFYPLYFKLGMIKMKFVNIFLFMILMFFPSFLAEYAASHPQSAAVIYITSLLSNTPAWVLQWLLLIAAFIMLLISVLISIHIYKNKDF
jgi:ABC-2 type transport system permease protein